MSRPDIYQVDLLDLSLDPSLLKPKMTCIDFQDMSPGILKPKIKIGKVEFESQGQNAQMRIVEMPAPPNAHSWVPDPIRYLEVSPGPSANCWLAIHFGSPVKRVEVSVAPGKTNVFASSAVSVLFMNSSNNSSAQTETVKGSYSIRTITFTENDNVRIGGGEFGPPESFEKAGDIKTVFVYGQNCDIALWQVCYWPG